MQEGLKKKLNFHYNNNKNIISLIKNHFFPYTLKRWMEMASFKTHLTDFLDDQKISYRVKYHSKPVFTSEDAAVERGVRLSQIVKTMLLTNGHDILAAVLPSHKRLDLKKIKKLSGNKNLQFMDKASIEQKTGLIVGAVAPVGWAVQKMRIFVDPTLFEEEFLDISSGNPNAGLELHRDILKGLLTKAVFAPITKEHE
jgi:Cys-tRNA(Pro) deacylase